jgi:ankyrin repeat protein
VLQWVKDGATVEPIPLPEDVTDAPDSDEEEGAVLDGESLHWSAIIGESEKLERMLTKDGIQVDGVDERGYTAFHQACGNGHVDVSSQRNPLRLRVVYRPSLREIACDYSASGSFLTPAATPPSATLFVSPAGSSLPR